MDSLVLEKPALRERSNELAEARDWGALKALRLEDAEHEGRLGRVGRGEDYGIDEAEVRS
ncbi:MAG: hypothetical protein NZ902_00395 [Acidilobaceae archaeon]|nr:hypothetical protein [Acidilobaceae archaeon]MCX8165296.1 hypothetical protein [Acidilobaceae archaeon]MDW7973722.1 hypothetical protein [Sulfolobales archaeon]